MRTIVLIDGQNLFHLARVAWAPFPARPSSPYAWPSYDAVKLAEALVAGVAGRTLVEIRFYTGVPDRSSQKFWHIFWTNKLRHLRRNGVYAYAGRGSHRQDNLRRLPRPEGLPPK